jgi:hypothetical protein
LHLKGVHMDRARLKHVISGLDGEKLTDWELEFCENVEKRFDKREKRTGQGYVTDGEEEILENLLRKKAR